MNNFSFFDADKGDVEEILKKMQNVDFEGKKMSVEQTNSGNGGNSGKSSSPRRSSSRSNSGNSSRSNSGGQSRDHKSKRRYRN